MKRSREAASAGNGAVHSEERSAGSECRRPGSGIEDRIYEAYSEMLSGKKEAWRIMEGLAGYCMQEYWNLYSKAAEEMDRHGWSSRTDSEIVTAKLLKDSSEGCLVEENGLWRVTPLGQDFVGLFNLLVSYYDRHPRLMEDQRNEVNLIEMLKWLFSQRITPGDIIESIGAEFDRLHNVTSPVFRALEYVLVCDSRDDGSRAVVLRRGSVIARRKEAARDQH